MGFSGVTYLVSHVVFSFLMLQGVLFHSSCMKAAVDRGEVMWSHTLGSWRRGERLTGMRTEVNRAVNRDWEDEKWCQGTEKQD